MPRFTERLERLERRRPQPGGLPTICVIPDDQPARNEALADVERRRARGEQVIAIGIDDDPLAALVEVAAP